MTWKKTLLLGSGVFLSISADLGERFFQVTDAGTVGGKIEQKWPQKLAFACFLARREDWDIARAIGTDFQRGFHKKVNISPKWPSIRAGASIWAVYLTQWRENILVLLRTNAIVVFCDFVSDECVS